MLSQRRARPCRNPNDATPPRNACGDASCDSGGRSGLTGRDFCSTHRLSEPSFYAWRREILDIDNNAAERTLRHMAIGRKNWLFAGSGAGAETAAILFSVTSSCHRHKVDAFAYLGDLLERLGHDPAPAPEVLPVPRVFPLRCHEFRHPSCGRLRAPSPSLGVGSQNGYPLIVGSGELRSH
ncbi:MAG: transposase [Gemmataceae bacterium]|nr:transposase [Gemmataceae bacterium]